MASRRILLSVVGLALSWVGPSENDPIPVRGKFREGKLILKTLPQAGRTVAFDEVVLTIDHETMSLNFA